MENRELTDFQVKCERQLIDRLGKLGRAISGRMVDGQSEIYITGTVEGTDVAFWIYDDGADLKSSRGSPMFERPDYNSLDDLAEDFVTSIIKVIEKATEPAIPPGRR